MGARRTHPLVLEAASELRNGKISRREFLQFATLLGLSAGTARLLAACAPSAGETPEITPGVTLVPQRGGVLRVARQVYRVDHPARFSTAVQEAGPWRHVLEYLTQMDARGMVYPLLLESWESSDDLMVWRLNLRRGVKFNTGKDFNADDVVFNFQQWLDVDVGSSMSGILSYLAPEGVQKADEYTVVLHLNEPTISVAYDLCQYPALIVPAGFGGDLTREPVGTGPFRMAEFAPGERARLVRREGYWKKGADGLPLPYLDEIVFVDLGPDRTADMAALQTGEVDTVAEPTIDMWEMAKDDPRFAVVSAPSASTRILRVRVDQEPWQDNRVRLALKHCQRREAILAAAYRSQGSIGNDSHVAPAHVDCSGQVEPWPFDPEYARALLSEAGHPDGLDVNLIVNNEERESLAFAQVLKEDAARAGFRITINPMPPSQYWEGWDQFTASITWWAHRPLAHQVMTLGYICDAGGTPVPWNESKWCDPEFEATLREVQRTLDLEERKGLVGKLERIQKERGPICAPFFLNVFTIIDKRFHGLEAVPDEIPNYHAVWREA